MERIFSQYQVSLIRQRMTKEDGFATEEEARAFGDNACGAACVKMVLEALGRTDVPSVKELMEEGIRSGFYVEPAGWIHKGLVRLTERYGTVARRLNIKKYPLELGNAIKEGGLVIASVSLEFNPEKRGGHLVVVHGIEFEGDTLKKVYFRDPSGFGQIHSDINGESFLKSWTGNIVIVHE